MAEKAKAGKATPEKTSQTKGQGTVSNKSDLIIHIASKGNISQDRARHMIDHVLDGIQDFLTPGSRLLLIGFGSFAVTHQEERTGRNPRTGDSLQIPASNQVRFRAGVELKKSVNKG